VLRYLVLRLAQGVITVYVVVSVVFVLLRLAPGDPAYNLMGQNATPEQLTAARERWGLDRPLPVQYAAFLGNAARGDFGDSFVWQQPALAVVVDRLPNTLLLAAAAILLTAAIGIPLGMAAALRRGRPFDAAVGALTVVGQSMPEFWVGVMLIFAFAVRLRLLPTSGFDGPASIVLPSVTIAVLQLAIVSRMVRGSLGQALTAPYVTAARARGLGERAVLWGHAARTAAIPVVTVLGTRFAAMINGVVVVEAVFSWPGLGSTAIGALEKRDYPLLQAVVIVTAALTVFVNLLVDLLYTRLDPRVRLGRA
jgi:peptide/nickel transport system permease protein